MSLLSALLCTFIWGTTFIAQETGMDEIGPFTFNSIRFFVGCFAIVPQTLKRAQALWPTSSREEQLHWVDIAWAIDAGYEYSPASEQLEPHVGEYGPWEIEWEEDRLSFTNQRTGLSWPLLPVEPFTFLMIGDEGAQVRFLPRDAGQAATPAMEVLRFQGGRTRRERTH